MKQVKAILFDMDGVLILSENLHYEIKKKLFKKYKYNLTKKKYKLCFFSVMLQLYLLNNCFFIS